jgi:hypothetical protein
MCSVRPGPVVASAALICLLAVVVRAQGLPVPYPVPPDAPVQPLPYSHRQHIELGLDCFDCHVQPDAGPQMTFPASDICLSCHETMPATSASLKLLTSLAARPEPIPWVRVYQLPDYVYWSHASHLDAGLTCAGCHGAVHENERMRRETNVASKNGCVTCHETRQVFSDCGSCHEPRQ